MCALSWPNKLMIQMDPVAFNQTPITLAKQDTEQLRTLERRRGGEESKQRKSEEEERPRD